MSQSTKSTSSRSSGSKADSIGVKRAGLIGSGIQASLTPALHMQEGAAQGFHYEYELMDLVQLGLTPSSLPELMEDAEKRGLNGLNITHPCKQLVLPLLDELSEDARALGAVNTVVLKNGRRTGYNTDWWGFAESFRRGLPDADLTAAVQIGAGGAGVGTAYAILSLGLKSLTVVDQEADRAVQLADTMGQYFPEASVRASHNITEAMNAASGIIHATPTGMAKYPGVPLPLDLLRPDHWVAEIVYFPLETELLREAKKRGCQVLDGGGMAVFQAVGAFPLFTGYEPDPVRMLRHFEDMAA